MSAERIDLIRAAIAPFVETDGEGDVDSEGLMDAIDEVIGIFERRAAARAREDCIKAVRRLQNWGSVAENVSAHDQSWCDGANAAAALVLRSMKP